MDECVPTSGGRCRPAWALLRCRGLCPWGSTKITEGVRVELTQWIFHPLLFHFLDVFFNLQNHFEKENPPQNRTSSGTLYQSVVESVKTALWMVCPSPGEIFHPLLLFEHSSHFFSLGLLFLCDPPPGRGGRFLAREKKGWFMRNKVVSIPSRITL